MEVQGVYYTLRARSATDDVDIIHTSTPASQNANWANQKTGYTLTELARRVQVVFFGTDAVNETINWKLWAYPYLGSAEYIANGTATLGQQVVDPGASTTEYYADTISISAEAWIEYIRVKDSGNDRIAKLVFDFAGYRHLACILTKGTCQSMGAKLRYISGK